MSPWKIGNGATNAWHGLDSRLGGGGGKYPNHDQDGRRLFPSIKDGSSVRPGEFARTGEQIGDRRHVPFTAPCRADAALIERFGNGLKRC